MKFSFSSTLLCFILLSCENKKEDRPNIIYIMVDDMGYGDLSIYRRKDYSTPVLDSLAKEGMRVHPSLRDRAGLYTQSCSVL